MLISVIIPTYNRLEYLKTSVSSVLNQSFKDFELIVVDDGSTDQTESWCISQPDIKYLKKENGGVSSARNYGIKQALGEWIAFLDSDDQWLPKKLEMQYNFMKENPTIKIIHTNELWYRKGVFVNQRKIHEKFGGWIFEKMLPLCLISPSAVTIHKDVFESVGVFDEELPAGEDYDLWLRITPFFEVGFINTPLIKKFGGHEDQLSSMWGIDSYRIVSLQKIIDSGVLSKNHKESALDMLQKKLEILIKGYSKHQKIDEANRFKSTYEKYFGEFI